MLHSVEDDPIRFADVLTTGSAVANYLGEGEVAALHLVHAIDILTDQLAIEDLGRPLSPLVRRTPPGMGSTVQLAVQELVQRWYAELGSNHAATMTEAHLARLRTDLEALRS